jgi:hypothetical protein
LQEASVGGIQFLTDEKGTKTAAVIDLKVHRALWEDIADVLVSRSRRGEKGVSLEKVKAGLITGHTIRW